MRLRTIPLIVWISMACLTVIIVCALFAPWVAPYGEGDIVGDVWAPMSADFWLGTDNLGRDILSRLIYGARTTLSVALSATLISFVQPYWAEFL